jgi:hypothetical protein
MMDRGREAGGASDGDKEDSARTRASLHADQHGQLGINIPESGMMDRGREAGCASNGDKEDRAGTRAS